MLPTSTSTLFDRALMALNNAGLRDRRRVKVREDSDGVIHVEPSASTGLARVRLALEAAGLRIEEKPGCRFELVDALNPPVVDIETQLNIANARGDYWKARFEAKVAWEGYWHTCSSDVDKAVELKRQAMDLDNQAETLYNALVGLGVSEP